MITTTKIYFRVFSLLAFFLLGGGSSIVFGQTVTPGIGGVGISADNFATGTWTTINDILIQETSPGQLQPGQIRLQAPAGFIWDIAGTDPIVNILVGLGNKITVTFNSRSTTEIIFDLLGNSGGNPPNNTFTIEIDNLRLRPSQGSPLISGQIRNAGSSAPGGTLNYGTVSMLTSRDQVGRAGTSVRLFVDNNSNGIYDEGDDNIEENAIRMDRTGTSSISKGGVTYFTQMQPYFQYNVQVNKGAIRNPMLVSSIEQFSLITDPNRFKKIEIPFYMSGVLEGIVEREFENQMINGISGLKLILQSLDGDYSTEVRTFSDGSYYMYELPPGNYIVKVDTTQLQILDSFSRPKARIFTVKPIRDGDFIEQMNFLVIPNSRLKALPESSSKQNSEKESPSDAPEIENREPFRKE